MQRQTPTGDEPKFSSKLKRIIGRAKRYLRRRKVAGIVIVYEPGFSEYLAMIDPPFSHVRFGKRQGEFIILDDLERFGGDEARRKEAMEQTMNMLLHLANMSRLMFQNFNTMAHQVEKRARVTIPEPAVKAEVVPIEQQDVDSKAKPATQEDHWRAVMYALLQDPVAAIQNMEEIKKVTEALEPLMNGLIEKDGGILKGITNALQQYLIVWEKAGEDLREFPCPECEEGDMIQKGFTQPNGSTHYECNKCGHTATFP